MKKNKLKLDKFSISKLSNPSRIVGGTGDTNDGGDTKLKMLCIKQSKEFVLRPVDD